MARTATESKSGLIKAKCWIEQSGYVPGQTLYFNGDVKNNSVEMMGGSRVQFKEVLDHFIILFNAIDLFLKKNYYVR